MLARLFLNWRSVGSLAHRRRPGLDYLFILLDNRSGEMVGGRKARLRAVEDTADGVLAAQFLITGSIATTTEKRHRSRPMVIVCRKALMGLSVLLSPFYPPLPCYRP